jgi:hypothetical protein
VGQDGKNGQSRLTAQHPLRHPFTVSPREAEALPP